MRGDFNVIGYYLKIASRAHRKIFLFFFFFLNQLLANRSSSFTSLFMDPVVQIRDKKDYHQDNQQDNRI